MTNPNFPAYIISKGRHESMVTSKSLSRMKMPHYIAIEPQDVENYEKALDHFGIRKWVTLLTLPFSNHGNGPGRARNWCWDHSMTLGYDKHWVMDDNIFDFYRLHKNIRIRVESGAIFRAAEDFVDRYENVPVSGFQYRFFIAPDSKYPPYVKNTRIYSTLLISNDCPHRWRGRYNEDTDLSLQILKDPRGFCTIQFNAFLQGKAATQTVAGGNTTEFYHNESMVKGADGKVTRVRDTDDKIWVDGVNSSGTINKSQMLKDMHDDGPCPLYGPAGRDLVEVVWKYKRWHHYVDYTRFKNDPKNQLRLKPGVVLPTGSNNYGMKLITNYGVDNDL
ncbi:MAG: hypothetical protein COA84_13325 [Robiginitomaculum sp.]|nr:MAG: hypothetical protein COA84_13325 [Robiginitomaculum sp.]